MFVKLTDGATNYYVNSDKVIEIISVGPNSTTLLIEQGSSVEKLYLSNMSAADVATLFGVKSKKSLNEGGRNESN